MNDGEYQCKFCTGDAWNRNVELSGEFSRKEAALWIINKQQHKRISELETKVLDMTLETEDNVTPFNLPNHPRTQLHTVTGGRDGTGADWLSPLPVGTIFYARPKNMPKKKDLTPDNSEFLLTQYQIAFVGKRMRQLQVTINMFVDRPDETVVIAVDPQAFCKQHGLYEALEELDDERYRTNQSGELADHEPVCEQHQELPKEGKD